jgi:two-component system nitrate/nitrite response regulator NarL
VGRSVLIVDDHPAFRAAARELLLSEGFVVVGEAADGASAIAAVGELDPDVVLLDVHLPDIDGFAVARMLPDDGPMVVLVSSHPPSSFRRRLAADPSLTFIPKSELSSASLEAAVRG